LFIYGLSLQESLRRMLCSLEEYLMAGNKELVRRPVELYFFAEMIDLSGLFIYLVKDKKN
jgi:hypothetical protein